MTSDSTPDGVSTTEQADTKRGKIDPEVERERYEGAWRTLDEHFKKFWLGIWLFPPVVLVVTAILGRFLYGLLAFGIALAVYFAIRWALKLDSGPSVHDFQCPRCGNGFYRKEKKTDTLSRKCLNCGLYRGALPPYFDPPVKPKQR